MNEEGTFCVGGQFREVVPSERLVFAWMWGDDHFADIETKIEIALADVAGGTELNLIYRRLSDGEAREKHAQGWNYGLDSLAADCLAGR
jgi:uncharacterized protein YndB with AHSA1/START domain